MPTRRALLSAGLTLTAGCTGLRSGTTGPNETGPGSPGESTGTPSGTGPGGAPAFARWRVPLPHEGLGLVSLGGGPETPALFVGSGTVDGERRKDDHALHALALEDGEEVWRVAVPNPVQTAPLFAGTEGAPRVVFATGQRSLHGRGFEIQAVEYTSGERSWTFDVEARRFLYPVAATEESVFVGQRDDQLAGSGESVYALAAVDGVERWQAGAGDVSRAGSARRRDVLFVRTFGRLYAFDVERGVERWQAPARSVAYDNRGERVFVESEGAVQALGVADGTQRWRRAFDGVLTGVRAPRAAMDGTVFASTYDGRLHALSPLDGTTRWTRSLGSDQFRPAVRRSSDRLYVADDGLHALDPVSGEQQWSFAPPGAGTVDVAGDAPGTVFAHTGTRLWALDPASGEARWTFAPGGEFAGVATAGDFAFVGVGGAVFALDGGAGSASE